MMPHKGASTQRHNQQVLAKPRHSPSDRDQQARQKLQQKVKIRSRAERSRNLDRSFRNIYIIPSFPTWEQHAHSVQNARSRFTKLNQSYSC